MEEITKNLSWVFQEVVNTALLYLRAHERFHCLASEEVYGDEGMATAWGLYWTLKNHVFSPAVLKTLENIESGLKSPSSREQSGYVYYHDPLAFVVRYLAVYEIANYHYQMPEYRKFVKYLKAPLARPEVYIIEEPSVLAFVRGDVFSGISIKIAPEKLPYTLLFHTYPYRSSIEIEVEKRESKFECELRPKYLGKEPKSISGDIIEVWGMCHRRLELEARGLIPINYEDLWPQYRPRKI